ncbi:MAG: ABC transporter ATP-binding protein [Chloroflexi bacterium]|nr:ABC transporter ATP-binding protein [Chloroflexota bacterium]
MNQNTTEPAVRFIGVTKSFITRNDEVVHTLQNVSFNVGAGEFVAIVGPSGCGKSTTLNVLACITAATRGEVLVRGRHPAEARLDIGYVFQQDTVLPWKRVLDNVTTGLVIRKVPAAERRRRALELIDVMGLRGFEKAYPFELSGGMRKRVALATTMAYDPSILLMDEPFGALDAQTRVLLQDELLRVWEANRKTVLFVTHDLPEAITLADRIIVMTARPARVKSEYIVDLPRPRTAAEARFNPHFDQLYVTIWNDLKAELTA